MAYIFLNRNRDMTATANAVTNPTIAVRAFITSVPTATDRGYSDHVWQLATQTPNSSERKKFSRQGRDLELLTDILLYEIPIESKFHAK